MPVHSGIFKLFIQANNLCNPFISSSSGAKPQISVTVFPPLRQHTASALPLVTTFHTESLGAPTSRTSAPVPASKIRTRPSFPAVMRRLDLPRLTSPADIFPPSTLKPLTLLLLPPSSCNAVTLLSCAGILCVAANPAFGLSENVITRPSEPPVTSWSRYGLSWSWQTSAVWPWRRAVHSLKGHHA
jgi:hypothetical protein